MRKILITGAHGLLAKHFIFNNKKKYQITGTIHRNNDTEIPDIELVYIDFASDWKTTDLPSNIDVVIHLAQSSNYRDFPNSAKDIFKVNVESTARLLDHAYRSGAKHFIYASSGGLYGYGSQAFKENAPVVDSGKLGYYLSSKYASEMLVKQYSSFMQVTILRFFFIYGQGQKRSMLLPRLIDRIRRREPINLQGQNGIRINPIHVSDATKALAASLGVSGNQIFNIAGNQEMSLFEICEIISDQQQIPAIFQRSDTRPKDLIGDVSAMKEKLHVPEIPFDKGIKDLIF